MTAGIKIPARRARLKAGECPVHKAEMDLVFSGFGGKTLWCLEPHCIIGAEYDENEKLIRIVRRDVGVGHGK